MTQRQRDPDSGAVRPLRSMVATMTTGPRQRINRLTHRLRAGGTDCSTMALPSRIARLETRLTPSVAAPDPAGTDRLRVRIASAVRAVESVLGAPDDVASYSLIERAARLHRLTAGTVFPWLPAVRDRRRRSLRPRPL